jgi:uncharacterized protein (TIGR00730 family)
VSGLRTICVFSGSSPGARPSYTDAATALGHEIASRGMRLVYGGASVGLMGTVADAALAAGGEVVGVIPQHLVDHEVAHPGLTELRITTSMHERKATMATLSDGFVALPGGFGTLEELAEILTWSQLGLQSKPSGLLDVEGFFEPLLAFFDHTVTERFVSEAHRALVLSSDSPGALLDRLADWRPDPAATKWLDR